MGGRVREAGDAGLLLQLGTTIDATVNARAVGIADALRRRQMRGVRDVVATYCSVAVHFDPRAVDREAMKAELEEMAVAIGPFEGGADLEVPVVYGGESGPDLEALAATAALPVREVVALHTAKTYRVFMLGFMPGFPYMGVVDARIAASRRATPRLRVERGSVGIAGIQTGIYPVASPGGWQIVGRSNLTLFDVSRPQPALFTAGDRVRFVAVDRLDAPPFSGRHLSPPTNPLITVVRPGLFTTIQDEGRWGQQSSGVPVAGAMDIDSLHAANVAVGNEPGAAALEATLIGPHLRFERPCALAIAGADLGATVDGRSLAPGERAPCREGSQLRFSGRRLGGRAYLAVEGGIAAPVVLGSRSTHVRAAMGGLDGRPLRAGDRLTSGEGHASPRGDGLTPRDTDATPGAGVPQSPTMLRVLRGPQDDWFDEEAFGHLESHPFTVQPDSDRMGFRLAAEIRIRRRSDEEMISDAAFTGAIQVPPSGHPILLMADRPTTGGYPQIAVVISADLPRAGQLVPGDTVRFSFCSWSDARAALFDDRGFA
jgi:KipI family sensor histidine kinase inhibitor